LISAEAYVASVQAEFDRGIFEHSVSGIHLNRKRFKPSDRDTVWNSFKRDLGYQLADMASSDASGELGYRFVIEFLENYVAIPHVEMP
jgi:hypothetical protein